MSTAIQQAFTLFVKHAWNRKFSQMHVVLVTGRIRVSAESITPSSPVLGQAVSTAPPTGSCGVEKCCRLATQSAFLPNYIQSQLTSIKPDPCPVKHTNAHKTQSFRTTFCLIPCTNSLRLRRRAQTHSRSHKQQMQPLWSGLFNKGRNSHVTDTACQITLTRQQQQEQDPTNLYISNLPVSMDEQELENMLKPFGHVISTRILRDANGVSRGPLLCKFADGGQKKRQSQSKYPQNGRPWHREGESGMTLTYDPSAMQNGFYSSPYSISTNRMIAQTSITPFIAASPVSTYQVQSTSWMPHQQYVMQPTGAVITPSMDHAISMQPANMMGPLAQQMNHLSLGTTGTYMTAAAAPMQGTYIPQYTPVPASAVSMEGVVTEASPQSVPSSQDAGGQQPLGMDNTSDHVPTYSFQSAK
ncbi:RNA-binding motif [Triplophysa rosa]|uniref:RNA-binding motif n=1 Tax=Triplophysa rosa TaxID=992332 RepID=A0A9W7WPU8_TRIRA|nr:RNA-binding motif [Triplophysa rosa]